jgi:DNA-binding NtrC family response regulator
MMVEDDDDVREGYFAYLEWAGLNVVAVASAEAALRKLHSVRPELILADVRLPGMSGLELLTKVRANDARIRFIVMTGSVELERTPDDAALLLHKPIKPQDLLGHVRRLLGLRHP